MQPYLINFGFLKIRYYGLFYAIGIIVGIKYGESEVRRKKLPITKDQIQNNVFGAFFFSLLCARLYYVLHNLGWYFSPEADWYEFLAVWRGGLAIHGGLIGAVIATAYISKRIGVKFFVLSDMVIMAILFGQVIGRFGNLMNGDAHGIPTDLPWGLVFNYGPAAAEFPGQALHPVMLYESILNFLLLIFLFRLRLRPIASGLMTSIYLIGSGISRFIASIFRADDFYFYAKLQDGTSHWLTIQQFGIDWGVKSPFIMSVISILLGIYLIWHFKLLNKPVTSTAKRISAKKGTKK